ATERLTLAEAVKRAIARNETARIAQAEIRRAEGLAEQARAGWFPTLIGTGMYTRLDDDRTFAGSPATATSPATPARVIAPRDSISANLTLTVPIIVPYRWASSSHAGDQVDLMRASDLDVKRTVAVATARAYLAVVAQKRVVDVAERARNAAKAHA